jgi:ABC-type Fe3+-hydroxamate transport system substrate-binding protein
LVLKGAFYFYTMSVKTFTDQLGNPVSVSFPPKRIISLVPSQTELLATLGLEEEVIGITKFCVHPEHWRKSKSIVGGTKRVNLQKIHSLEPDLIIGNKEENDRGNISELQKYYPVWMSDVVTFSDALLMIEGIGKLTDTEASSLRLQKDIQESLFQIKNFQGTSVLYLIWKEPWMGAATGTFIHEMLQVAGFTNCLAYTKRYPELSEEVMKQLNPDVVMLSSEPYPFSEKHIDELQAIFPEVKIVCVDGELFSWYGSRMLNFAGYINSLKPQVI